MAHDEYKKVNAINVYYMHDEESDPKAMMIWMIFALYL